MVDKDKTSHSIYQNNSIVTKETFVELLDHRKNVLIEIQKLTTELDIEIDKKVHLHILKHIKGCKDPTKLINPDTIKIKNIDLSILNIDNDQNICPLSQAPITNKYVAKCGHVFEKKNLIQYLKNGPKSCPVAGCHKILHKL